MGCSCSSSDVPKKSINNFKQSIRNRNETVIVEWSKATYAGGGAYGDIKFDGVVSLTNISFYFVANGNKFELPLKRIDEIQEVRNNYADLKKPNERFAVFKLKENREFGMVFLENQDKLHSDLKTLIIQQGQGSKVEIQSL